MSIVIDGDHVTVSYGRQYEEGPFETCCPVDPGCWWYPQGRTRDAVISEIQEHLNQHRGGPGGI